ncbi:MAG: hypothetical protein C5B46_06070 [Proteobacteria bacterium]|nr:MAG: hypothetical protein C5B46_06070 [Pseudomonadota bacterium]
MQQQINSHPAGTVFCVASGTYVLEHYVMLKDSNQFICAVRRTCLLTGLDKYRGALAAEYGTQGHVIRGFIVEHFIAVPGQWPLAGLQARANSLIEDNESRYNQTGIDVFTNMVVRSNFVHHNRQYGISGGPATNVLIEDNELAWNNTAQYDPNNDAGGSKIVGSSAGTDKLTWRRNHVHDNFGQGIWSDGNVRHVLYEENLIENNTGAGIDHEISWDAVIRNNVLRNNNTAERGLGKSCWHGSQIALNNSQNVAIYGNTVEAVDTNPLCLANTVRSEPSVFPQFLANINVTNNIIKMRGTVYVGMVGNSQPSNVMFSSNTYYVDTLTGNNWMYMNDMNSAQWQAAGQDVSGTFLTW